MYLIINELGSVTSQKEITEDDIDSFLTGVIVTIIDLERNAFLAYTDELTNQNEIASNLNELVCFAKIKKN